MASVMLSSPKHVSRIREYSFVFGVGVGVGELGDTE